MTTGVNPEIDPEPVQALAQGFFSTLPSWNVTGRAAIAVPAGRAADGLPIGVQLVGRPHDEATLLRVAAQLEARR